MADKPIMADAMKEIVVCKHCNKNEFYGKFYWLSGWTGCRSCYKERYREIYNKIYEWDDISYTDEELKQLERGPYVVAKS